MPHQTKQAEEKRQEVIFIVGLIFFNGIRRIFHIVQTPIINKRNTTRPIAFALIRRREALLSVLTTCKIPHKISPIHPAYLIAEEETPVITNRRAVCWNLLILRNIHPQFIVSRSITFVMTHAREQYFIIIIENIIRLAVNDFIFITYPTITIFRYLVNWTCIELRSKQQRTITILLTIEVRNQANRISWIVHIYRWIGIRANQNSADR